MLLGEPPAPDVSGEAWRVTGTKEDGSELVRMGAVEIRSLFVGSGGYVTCGWADCPDPSAADKLLAVGQPLAAAIRDLVAAAILMEQQ
jgi:hypothetical protein